MNILFVKLLDEGIKYPKSYFKKIWLIIKIKFRQPIFQKINNMNILYLANINNKKAKNTKKTIQKIKKKNNIEQIAIAKNLPENFKNQIEDIIRPKELMLYLVEEILEYICTQQKEEISKKDITILATQTNSINIYWIELLSKYAKSITIVTTQISKFLTLEKKLSQQYGVAIMVTNNKRKSLQRTKIIINLDFDEELLNKYQININAIIINITNQIKKLPKQFQGTNINQIEIILPQEIEMKFKQNYLNNVFSNNILYLSTLDTKKFVQVREKIEKDKIQILYTIGISGVIQKEEFMKKT